MLLAFWVEVKDRDGEVGFVDVLRSRLYRRLLPLYLVTHHNGLASL